MSRLSRGPTAIEVAIVLTVAGSVATFAWPWYSSYGLRAQVAEVVAAADSAKVTVDEYAAANGALPPTAAIVLPFINAAHVAGSDWAASGAPGVAGSVTLRTRSTPNRDESAFDAKAIVWTASYNPVTRAVDWRCGGTPATTVDERYLPHECRSAAGAAEGASRLPAPGRPRT